MNYASRNHTVYKISNYKSTMLFDFLLEVYYIYVLNLALAIKYQYWTVNNCIFIAGNGMNNLLAVPIVVFGTFYQRFFVVLVRFIMMVSIMQCIEGVDFLPYFIYFVLVGVPPLLESCKQGEITDYVILEP